MEHNLIGTAIAGVFMTGVEDVTTLCSCEWRSEVCATEIDARAAFDAHAEK